MVVGEGNTHARGRGGGGAKTSVEEKKIETNESDSKITLYSTENNFKRSTSSVLYTCN